MDSYSAFFDNAGNGDTGLAIQLVEKVTEVKLYASCTAELYSLGPGRKQGLIHTHSSYIHIIPVSRRKFIGFHITLPPNKIKQKIILSSWNE